MKMCNKVSKVMRCQYLRHLWTLADRSLRPTAVYGCRLLCPVAAGLLVTYNYRISTEQ
jgi:hypothetical protein